MESHVVRLHDKTVKRVVFNFLFRLKKILNEKIFWSWNSWNGCVRLYIVPGPAALLYNSELNNDRLILFDVHRAKTKYTFYRTHKLGQTLYQIRKDR